MNCSKCLTQLAATPNPKWTSARVHWFALLLACLLGVPGLTLAAPGDIMTFAGGGGQGSALSIGQAPAGVVVSGAFVYVADSFNHVVRRLDTKTGNQIVVAGNGTWGFSGDGGAATSAQLFYASGLAVDPSGNLFIADTFNERIRKVDPTGTITTVAGNGNEGFGGDGGIATDAQLSSPSDVAVDAAGNMLIADVGNHRIRKVDVAGTITTAAGTGAPGFSGDGGPATAAQLRYPSGVTVDTSGNLFIADAGNNRIGKVDTGGTITTVVGTGGAGFSGDGGPASSARLKGPVRVAVDATGNLFIADTGNNRIRMVNAAGTITTAAGTGLPTVGGDGGPATRAELNYPSGLAMDSAGNLIIGDAFNQRIRKVDAAGTITTVAGTGTAGFSGDGGPATSAELFNGFVQPSGVAADMGGNLSIADVGNQRIRKVDLAGTIRSIAGTGTPGFSGDGGQATTAQLFYPAGVALDPSGNLFIADTNNCSIRMIDPAGVITTVAGNGTVGSSGDGGPATGAQLGYPSGVALDASGNLFIADAGNNRIRKVDSGGTITTVVGTGSAGFSGDGGPGVSAQLNSPSGMAVDTRGNLFLADAGNNRIRKVDSGGTITTIAGVGTTGFSGDGGPASSAQLNNPSGVVLDATGNLFIADSGNNRIRVVEASTPTCTGDCNHDDRVAVNELILGVNIALGRQQLAACPEFDENTQEGVEINELITAVDNALNGCGAPWWRLVAVLGLLEARGRFGRRG